MALRFRKLSILGAVVLAVTTLTPGTATADSWWDNPNTCTNIQTATQHNINGRTIEVRYGMCGGSVHGWGRLRGYITGSWDGIQLQVDLNGDWSPDLSDTWNATIRNFTRGYHWPSVPGRYFRACYLHGSVKGCTAWT